MRYAAPLALCLTVLLSACGPKIEDYAGKTPTLDIRHYLNGNLEAWGVFYTRGGDADPRMFVKLKGTWAGADGKLAEDFTYSDGRRQQREWHLHMQDDHHFTATAADVIGTAYGKQYGNAVNMKYTLHLTTAKGDTHDVDMDDWLYLVDDQHLSNRAEMSKFGLRAGEVLLGFRKLP
jgi:hypothetical protein